MNPYTEPQWDRVALIIIDTQNDTLDGQPFEVHGTSDVLPEMKILVEAFRQAKKNIIHIVRLYKADGSNTDLCRRTLGAEKKTIPFQVGSRGSQIAEALMPQAGVELDTNVLLNGGVQNIGPNEVVMYKPRWGAFFKTSLEAYLQSRAVSTLVFCGCNYPNCPRASLYEASERDFRVVLVDDALSGLDAQGRLDMRNIGVVLLPTGEVASAVGKGGDE